MSQNCQESIVPGCHVFDMSDPLSVRVVFSYIIEEEYTQGRHVET